MKRSETLERGDRETTDRNKPKTTKNTYSTILKDNQIISKPRGFLLTLPGVKCRGLSIVRYITYYIHIYIAYIYIDIY